MKQKRLSIYQIDMKYVRDLAKVDDKAAECPQHSDKNKNDIEH